MRTEAIDRACGRFRSLLSGRLGPAFDVPEMRVTFDSRGRHLRCRTMSPDGSLELVLGSPDPHGKRFSWHLSGERARIARWRPEITVGEDIGPHADELCEAVRPRELSFVPLEPGAAIAELGEEGARVLPGLRAFERYYGRAIRLVALEGDRASSIVYPHVTEQEVLLYAPPPFRQDARMAAYLEDLGFAVDRHHRVNAVPLPSGFERRRARLGIDGGLRPELRSLRATLFSAGAWLAELAGGAFPINVNGPLSNALSVIAPRAPLHRSQHEKLNTHFHVVGHDMGIHALSIHRVPPGHMRELRRLATIAVRRGKRATDRAARFFEERLTRTCIETWAEVTHPDRFAERFEEVFPTLRSELAAEVYA